MGQLEDRITDLDAIGDRGLCRLAELVRRVPFPEAVRSLDRFLLGRLAERYDDRLGRQILMLARDNPGASVSGLADRMGYSDRQFRRLCRDTIGTTPKRAARILRLRRATSMMGGQGSTLTEIALGAGYYDQAHFDRDFRAMVGMTPSAFMARQSAMSAAFNRYGAE